MSNTKKPAAVELDAATFDLDLWIDATVRPEGTVVLHPLDIEHLAKITALEAQIPDAEKVGPENRGLDDVSPEGLLAQIAVLRAEREATALKVRVRQLTEEEIRVATAAAVEAGAEDGITVTLWRIAAACVEPAFTPDQLIRLRARDRSGEHMADQLADTFMSLLVDAEDVSVPS